jgi:hypothetical protein
MRKREREFGRAEDEVGSREGGKQLLGVKGDVGKGGSPATGGAVGGMWGLVGV